MSIEAIIRSHYEGKFVEAIEGSKEVVSEVEQFNYAVSFYESGEKKRFHCVAEDMMHAKAQCQAAHPNAIVLDAWIGV